MFPAFPPPDLSLRSGLSLREAYPKDAPKMGEGLPVPACRRRGWGMGQEGKLFLDAYLALSGSMIGQS